MEESTTEEILEEYEEALERILNSNSLENMKEIAADALDVDVNAYSYKTTDEETGTSYWEEDEPVVDFVDELDFG